MAKRVGRTVWIATVLCGLLGARAIAAPATTTWTGYLYQGPGYRYLVTDEVAQATSVDLIGCENEWCEVMLENRRGYIRADIVNQNDLAKPRLGVLTQPAASLGKTSPPGPCFEANQTGGNGGNAKTIFCGR